MTRVKSLEINQIIKFLKMGKVGVIPTDTIYGIVGSALNPHTVEKIYKLRERAADKPFIILIANLNDLNQFNIKLTDKMKIILKKIWPNPVSVVLPFNEEKFKYLHRSKKSLAFRIPNNEWLINLLKQSGSLVAPSANIEGGKPSETIEEAKKYFGDKVDFYVDGGKMSKAPASAVKSAPSTLIRLMDDGSYQILRQGSYKLLFKL